LTPIPTGTPVLQGVSIGRASGASLELEQPGLLEWVEVNVHHTPNTITAQLFTDYEGHLSSSALRTSKAFTVVEKGPYRIEVRWPLQKGYHWVIFTSSREGLGSVRVGIRPDATPTPWSVLPTPTLGVR